MSLAQTLSQKVYVADGGTFVFPTTFAFKANGDIVVELENPGGVPVYVPVYLGVDYTLTGAGVPEPGGNVTFIVAPPADYLVRITRNTPRTQPTSFPSQGEFLPAVHEAALDREEMQIQEIDRRLSVVEAGAAPVTLASSRVQNTFNVLDPPEGSFPFNVACAGTPSIVTLGRVEDLTAPAAIQSVGLPDISVMAVNQFTVRNVPGLIPGHQYRLTWLVSTI